MPRHRFFGPGALFGDAGEALSDATRLVLEAAGAVFEPRAAVFAAGSDKSDVWRFRIRGMHCTGCASGIEAMLRRVDGVSKADVSFEEKVATVEYDPAKANAEKIIAAIEKMGYKAALKK